jgi:hypothetical protein
MLFWITRTRTVRTLVEAPSRAAADAYSHSDAFADYCASVSPNTEDTIEPAGTHPRMFKAPHVPTPDVCVGADGVELEEDEQDEQEAPKPA